MTGDAREKFAKRVAAGVKSTVGVTPRMELHDVFSLPRMTSGQGKTACHGWTTAGAAELRGRAGRLRRRPPRRRRSCGDLR